MITDYPLSDVRISEVKTITEVSNPVYKSGNWEVSRNEAALRIKGVGCFYARNGDYVEVSVSPATDDEWVRLYLKGQILVVLLHQRGIMNFHASSFVYQNTGVMVLGDTGAGKTSLTVAFTLMGAGFLTDDLTPVVFREGIPVIVPLNREAKLRQDTAGKLEIDPAKLRKAEEGTGKQYMSIERPGFDSHSLNMIIKIEAGECSVPEFHEMSAGDRFSMLRSDICSWELLAAMPGTEAAYLQQLVRIVETVRITKVIRPLTISISDFRTAIEEFLAKELY
jgi:hypothetical protein